MEAAGLGIGAVSFLIAAVGAYQTLHDRLNTLRNHNQVARRLWLKYRFIQRRVQIAFRLFFAPVLLEDDPWQYMQQTGLSARQQTDVATYIDQTLGADSASMLAEVFNEISTILNEVRTSLAHVEPLAIASAGTLPQTPTMKIKAVKEVVNLTLQESQYDRQLEELRTWVGDLCDMLSTRGSSLAQDPVNKIKQTLPLPSSVNAINKASKQLGTGLEKAWTCLNTNHGGHDAVLRFDAQLDMEDDVHMNVAISCRSSNSRTPQAPHEGYVWLHVKSVAPTVLDHEQHKRVKTSTATPHATVSNCSHVVPSVSQNKTAIISQHPRPEHGFTHCKLDGLPNVCYQLREINFSRPIQDLKCCHGYTGTVRGFLGTSTGYKHVVYHSKTRNSLDQTSPTGTPGSQPVSNYLNSMTASQQLHTAYEVTMGLLKYNQTAWLPEEWSLSDISYLGSSSFDHNTLHLTKRLPGKVNTSRVHISNKAATTSSSSQELRTLLGVRNAPLANLGYALLELAHRKPLKELRQPGDPHNAVAARRLVNGVDTIFGVRYRHLVRKCLEADFVVDCTDLADGRLQTAVYNDVALELDSLAKEIDSILSSI